MVHVSVEESGGHWFGIAYDGGDLVATAIGSDRESALTSVQRCIPSGVKQQSLVEPSPFSSRIAEMLARLEDGDESRKEFTLSSVHIPEWLRRVLTVASAIPKGYVTSYGNIADVAGTEARAVGRVMATNPLYPILPCHRVVGSDMNLVGYGGRQDDDALTAKLNRLRVEAQGYSSTHQVEVEGGLLTVYPVEWVEAAVRSRRDRDRRKGDTLQLPLFD